MKLDDIIELWRTDSKIDDLNIDQEAGRVPLLHAKYAELLTRERSGLRALFLERKKLQRDLREYYLGTATSDILTSLNRIPQAQRILKTEVYSYIESDVDILILEKKIQLQEEKVELLTEIMKSVNSRGFTLKNIIEWKKLMLGN